MSEKNSEDRPSVSASDIEARDIPRRSFLRRLGVVAGATVMGTGAAACELSDSCDRDVGDPVRADNDPRDPVRADADYGDRCDWD